MGGGARGAPVLVVERAAGGGVGRERGGIHQLRLLREEGECGYGFDEGRGFWEEEGARAKEDRHLRRHQWTQRESVCVQV